MRIVHVSSYPPTKCGLATFTERLSFFLSSTLDAGFQVVAVERGDRGIIQYPTEVVFTVNADEVGSYVDAAKYINSIHPDFVLLQHEYRLYGGVQGSFIIELMRRVECPVIPTFHMVYSNPRQDLLCLTREMAELSAQVVVLTKISRNILVDDYRVDLSKISIIPHGIELPSHSFFQTFLSKPQGNFVGVTMGLMRPDKGIETAIRALPILDKRGINFLYKVVGETHPGILMDGGNTYLEDMEGIAADLGVSQKVMFLRRFLGRQEFLDTLQRAHLYIAPYLSDQVSSGTMTSSMGLATVVVTTPTPFAREFEGGEELLTFPFDDEVALAQRVVELCEKPDLRMRIARSAFRRSLSMSWNRIAESYALLLQWHS